MAMLWSSLVGALVAVVGGHYFTVWLLDVVAGQFRARWGGLPSAPAGIAEDVWNRNFIERQPGGEALGHLERLLFFAAFWIGGGWLLAAAWLAFKAAAKWHTWSQAAKLLEVGQVTDQAALLARATMDYRFFVLGTAANLVAGLAGLGVGGLLL
jgi:hypothetical protein